MTTNAPQIPVKIITALWFSILAPGISPNQSQNKNIKKRPAQSSGQSQAALLHSHDNPTEGKREIMMMTARTPKPDPRSCWRNCLISARVY